MKKFLMLVFAVVLAVSAVCFAEAPKAAEGTQAMQTQAAAAYKTLTPQQAKQRMEQNDKIVVLDVRTKEEFAAGHIPGAVLLPVDLIEANPKKLPKFFRIKMPKFWFTAAAANAHTVHRRRWQTWVIQILNISAVLWTGRMK